MTLPGQSVFMSRVLSPSAFSGVAVRMICFGLPVGSSTRLYESDDQPQVVMLSPCELREKEWILGLARARVGSAERVHALRPSKQIDRDMHTRPVSRSRSQNLSRFHVHDRVAPNQGPRFTDRRPAPCPQQPSLHPQRTSRFSKATTMRLDQQNSHASVQIHLNPYLVVDC